MSSRDNAGTGASSSTFDAQAALGLAPPTYAAFSPVTLSANTPSRNSRRSTVLVHQKSPLLLATPPQITRALAYSHPFLLPLNTFVGLLTWTSGDPWQSFLLLSAFWAVVLYGDVVLLRAGPIVLGAGFIAGMYSRRYSSLSSSAFSQHSGATPAASSEDATDKQQQHVAHGNKAKSEAPKTSANANVHAKHQKTLDEIVETLREFTGRCNMLMDPLLEMTDFLSTQRTPTSATTKPALTAMFVRLLIVTPFWIALTMSPWRIITTRRVVFLAGTIMLTWHSRVMRVTRAILWRSAAVRRLAAAITGLSFENPHCIINNTHSSIKLGGTAAQGPSSKRLDEARPAKAQAANAGGGGGGGGSAGLNLSHRRNGSLRGSGGQAPPSVKFTFIIYENQRRWVGLGWTASLFAYERPAWTDEHHNGVSHKDEFELPDVEDGSRMRWQWSEGSRWRVDGVPDDEDIDQDGPEGRNGWIYYDNKWQNGKRGLDGWGRWTRRRKWYRDAELVEADEPPPALELDATDTVPAPHTESYSTANEKMRVEPPLPPRPPDMKKTTSTAATAKAILREEEGHEGEEGEKKKRENMRKKNVAGCVDEDHSADGLGVKADDDAGLLISTSRFWPLRRRVPPPMQQQQQQQHKKQQQQQQQRQQQQQQESTAPERPLIDSGSSSSITTASTTTAGSLSTNGTSHIHGSSQGWKKSAASHHDIGGSSGKHGMVVDEDDTSGLGLEVELELQKQNKEGGQWGIGDEARMSLE